MWGLKRVRRTMRIFLPAWERTRTTSSRPGVSKDAGRVRPDHGPGSKHAESASAEDIINPGKLSGVSGDKECLTCHVNRNTHTGRIFGSHARGQVSCATCQQLIATTPQT
jgi:hypothetical protein